MDLVVKKGDKVRYSSYIRPHEILVGTVTKIVADKDQRKKFKYVIKPDIPIASSKGTVERYHPTERVDGMGNKIRDIEDIIGLEHTDAF